MKKVSIGYLASSHGIKGEAKVKGFGSSWDYLTSPVDLLLSKADAELSIRILDFSLKTNYILIRVEGVDYPEFWKDWQGSSILLDESVLDGISQTRVSNPDEYFFYQLEGLQVYTTTRQNTGFIVTKVDESPAHPILHLEGKGRKISIPFVKEWVGDVNLLEKYLVVMDWETWLAL